MSYWTKGHCVQLWCWICDSRVTILSLRIYPMTMPWRLSNTSERELTNGDVRRLHLQRFEAVRPGFTYNLPNALVWSFRGTKMNERRPKLRDVRYKWQDILIEIVSVLGMMNCPSCGTIMVWLNGSVLHDTPEKIYECRNCQLSVVKHSTGDYDMRALDGKDSSERSAWTFSAFP